ncbi:MAG: hypothetical protein HY791_16950 [Deltaproteobacteria bacterium]|nr:hypothetical protein [Deltaproteobacteria bacterium]
MWRSSCLGILILIVAEPAFAELPFDGVRRAEEDDIGLFFRFGGLATLDASGNTRRLSDFLVQHVGLRFVLSDDEVMPVFFGTGARVIVPDSARNETIDVGLEAGLGYEYHFRVWNRISPFVGLTAGIGALAPSDEDEILLGMGLGPTLGVEYYVADKVSLSAEYSLSFQLDFSPEAFTAFAVSTRSGGALDLCFYF